MNVPILLDEETGEIKNLVGMSAKEFDDFVLNLPDEKKADVFSQSNFMRKMYEKLEKKLKKAIKEKDFKWDEKGIADFHGIKITKTKGRKYFNKEKFELEGTKEEKIIYDQWKIIEDRYSVSKEVVKI